MSDKTDNELIAEFMGMELGTCFGQKGAFKYNGADEPDFMGHHTLELYKTSWDWLMLVVEKIESLYKEAFPGNAKCVELILSGKSPVDDHYIDVVSTSICTSRHEVYDIVIRFIKWYNETQSKS